jgi:uncharacterized protein (TIGR02996 family)
VPTDEQRALWAAIRAHPDDDAPRLVYADWLDEHGDAARAEFIRVQIERVRMPTDRRKGRKRREWLNAREAELQAAHKHRWTEPLRKAVAEDRWLNSAKFSRGFLRRVRLPFPTAERLIVSGVEPEPIDHLAIDHVPQKVTPSPAAVAAVAGWQFGAYVHTFGVVAATDAKVRAFLTGGRLSNLFRLALSPGTVSDTVIAELANSPLIAPLRALDLSYNRITDAGALALLASPHLSAECDLNLRYNPIGPGVTAALRRRFG